MRVRAALLGAFAVLGTGVASADTTLQRRVVPGAPANGYTPLVYGPGDPTVVRGDLTAARPGRERRRRSLLYFAQLSDFQLADEESPLRVEIGDQLTTFVSAAWRPQEALMPFVIDASIRQVNANRRSPIPQRRGKRAKLALTILTGDNADNQGANETAWVNRLLDGGELNPNSGVVDDASLAGSGCAGADRAQLAAEAPLYTGVQDYDDYVESGTFYDPDRPVGQWAAFPRYPGLMDRAQRPFLATGLKVPAYVALGNHDGLVQGNQAATAELAARATGCLKTIAPAAAATTLDVFTTSFFDTDPARTVVVPPDPARAPVTKPQYRKLLGDRHGFEHVDPAEARASDGAASYYTFSPRRGLRFVTLDTVANAGIVGLGSEGNVDDPQFQWLTRVLDAAERADELVFVTSHHGPTSLSTDVGDEVAGSCETNPDDAGCDLDPRSSTPLHLQDDLVQLLLAHPHVVAWVAGHSHVNDVAFYKSAKTGFWVVRTSAEADYPHQDRLLELMDNRDGTLSLFGTLLDDAAPPGAPASGTEAAQMTGDQLASIARTLGYNDPQVAKAAVGDPPDRNVELLVRDPRLRVTVRVKGRRVRVRVTRASAPVPGARVRVGRHRAVTDARGRATLRVRRARRVVVTTAGLRKVVRLRH